MLSIPPETVLAAAWAIGTLAAVTPTMRRLSRLRERDPVLMCDGCRSRRSSLLCSPDDPAVYTLLEVLAAPWRPITPWLRTAAGSQPQPHCAGPSCAAHARHQPVGRTIRMKHWPDDHRPSLDNPAPAIRRGSREPGVQSPGRARSESC